MTGLDSPTVQRELRGAECIHLRTHARVVKALVCATRPQATPHPVSPCASAYSLGSSRRRLASWRWLDQWNSFEFGQQPQAFHFDSICFEARRVVWRGAGTRSYYCACNGMSGSAAEAPDVDSSVRGDVRGAAEFARQVAMLGRAASAPPLGARGGKQRRQGRASAARAKHKTAAPINPASEARLR